MSIRETIARSTLADANEKRDWRTYQDFAHVLTHHARELYSKDAFGLSLQETVYALDSTTTDLCLALFPWAKFRTHKGVIKMQTLLDLRGNIPSFLAITDPKGTSSFEGNPTSRFSGNIPLLLIKRARV